MVATSNPAIELWDALSPEREPFLRRAYQASAYTIPRLIRDPAAPRGEDLVDQYQSIGAEGASRLASKLLIRLFPVNSRWFELDIVARSGGRAQLEALSEEEIGNLRDELTRIEERTASTFEHNGYRVGAYRVLLHLIVGGTCVFHAPKGRRPRVSGLPRFCVERDSRGMLSRLVVSEGLHPDDARDRAMRRRVLEDPRNGLLTLVERVGTEGSYSYRETQYRGNTAVGDPEEFSVDALPWIVPRFDADDEDAYGRSLVENLLGDLQTLEGVSQGVVEMLAAAAAWRWLADPAGSIRPSHIEESVNGQALVGRPEDLSVTQGPGGQRDIAAGRVLVQDLRSDIRRSFLDVGGVQRAGERVTAYEIERFTGELEEGFGGPFANVTQEFQLPLAALLLEHQDSVPEIADGKYVPRSVVGVESLGKAQDLLRIRTATQIIRETVGEQALQAINVPALVARIFRNSGLAADDLTLDEQTLQGADLRANIGAFFQSPAGAALIQQIGEQARRGQAPTS